MPSPSSSQRPMQIWLTREGWVFLTVLLFITVGAILRSVNLLIFMAGMMCLPLLLNWRLLRHWLSHIRATRTVPLRVHAGHLVNIQWEVANLSRMTSAWNIGIEDRLEPVAVAREAEQGEPGSSVQVTRFADSAKTEPATQPGRPLVQRLFGQWLGRHTRESVRLTFPEIDPQQSEYHSYRCLFATRGLYRLGPAQLHCNFPFGLVSGHFQLPARQDLIVAPRLGTLTADWDRRIRSVALGSESTNRQLGFNEEEFYAVRQWRSGDNPRHIHWRSTAKRQLPMVRQFDQLSNRDMAIVLDLHVPAPGEAADSERSAREADCEVALSFGATVIAETSAAVQGRVGICLSGDRSTVIIDRNHHEFLVRVMRELAVAQPGPSTELPAAVAHLARNISTGTPIYVISTRPQPEPDEEDSGPAGGWSRHTNWLTIDSPIFRQLFSLERTVDIDQMESLQEKWTRDDSR